MVKQFGQAEVTVAIAGSRIPDKLTRNVSIMSVRDKDDGNYPFTLYSRMVHRPEIQLFNKGKI